MMESHLIGDRVLDNGKLKSGEESIFYRHDNEQYTIANAQ
jgi:hypothetical protein